MVVVVVKQEQDDDAAAAAWGTWEELVLGGAVLRHGAASGADAPEALQATIRDFSAPISGDTDAETLEAHRLALIESGKKLATMRRLTEAYQREVDHAVYGTPTAGGPSRMGVVK